MRWFQRIGTYHYSRAVDTGHVHYLATAALSTVGVSPTLRVKMVPEDGEEEDDALEEEDK
jgi:hypothetical protein